MTPPDYRGQAWGREVSEELNTQTGGEASRKSDVRLVSVSPQTLSLSGGVGQPTPLFYLFRGVKHDD